MADLEANSPLWVRDAYANSSLVHHIILDCAQYRTPIPDVAWKICEALYGENSRLKLQAIHHAMMETKITLAPRPLPS